LNALIPLVRMAPMGFHHNWMNLNHIDHAQIIPCRDGTTFHLIVFVKVHVCTSSKLRSTHILGASRFDFAKNLAF